VNDPNAKWATNGAEDDGDARDDDDNDSDHPGRRERRGWVIHIG
jgi:hypothetical protein